MICGWINTLQTVRTGWEGGRFSRSVVSKFSEWWQVVREGRVVLGEEGDGSCVKSELYGHRDLRCGWMVGVDYGLECLSK